MIQLYHGSTVYIERIDLQKSRPNKDFGRGFYLSADRQQAWRMGEFKALTEGGAPVMNTYLFDETVLISGELRVLTFEGYTREWAEFIFLNRNNRSTKPAHDYDIVYGPIARSTFGRLACPRTTAWACRLESTRLATSPSTCSSRT